MIPKHRGPNRIFLVLSAALFLAAGCSEKPKNSPQAYSSARIDTIEKPGHNLTGVYQTAYYRQSLLLIKKLAPSAVTFATITDKTTTGKTLLESLKMVDSASLPLRRKDSLVAKMASFSNRAEAESRLMAFFR